MTHERNYRQGQLGSMVSGPVALLHGVLAPIAFVDFLTYPGVDFWGLEPQIISNKNPLCQCPTAFHRLWRLVFVALRCWETNSLQRKVWLAAKGGLGGDKDYLSKHLQTPKVAGRTQMSVLSTCMSDNNGQLRWDKEGLHVAMGVGFNNLSIKNDKFQNSIWTSLTKLQNKNYRFAGCTWRSVNAQRRVWGTGNMEDTI